MLAVQAVPLSALIWRGFLSCPLLHTLHLQRQDFWFRHHTLRGHHLPPQCLPFLLSSQGPITTVMLGYKVGPSCLKADTLLAEPAPPPVPVVSIFNFTVENTFKYHLT